MVTKVATLLVVSNMFKRPVEYLHRSYRSPLGNCEHSAIEFSLASSLTTVIPSPLFKQYLKSDEGTTLERASNCV